MTSTVWDRHPDYPIEIVPCENSMRIMFKGVPLAESQHPLQLKEQDYPPVYYFPANDVRMDLLEKTDKVTHCPYKGDATHWALNLSGTRIEVAAWSYAKPFKQVSAIAGYIAFYPDVIDEIIED